MFLLNSVEPDVVKFLNAISAAGVTLTSTQKNAVDELVKRLMSAGIYQKCKAIYPMIGGSAASHKFNLKNPVDTDAGFRLVFTGAPTHSANGIAWNGTTQYADTFFNPTLNGLTQNDAHLSYYSRTNSNGNETEIGIYDGATGGGYYVGANFTGTQYQAINSIEYTGPSGLGTASQGLFTGSRINGTQEFHKRANGAVRTDSVASDASGYINGKVYLGAVQSQLGGGTSIPDSYTTKQCAFASIGLGLTSAQLGIFRTIVQDYQTRLGRQV